MTKKISIYKFFHFALPSLIVLTFPSTKHFQRYERSSLHAITLNKCINTKNWVSPQSCGAMCKLVFVEEQTEADAEYWLWDLEYESTNSQHVAYEAQQLGFLLKKKKKWTKPVKRELYKNIRHFYDKTFIIRKSAGKKKMHTLAMRGLMQCT